jgi:hypothetical protein
LQFACRRSGECTERDFLNVSGQTRELRTGLYSFCYRDGDVTQPSRLSSVSAYALVFLTLPGFQNLLFCDDWCITLGDWSPVVLSQFSAFFADNSRRGGGYNHFPIRARGASATGPIEYATQIRIIALNPTFVQPGAMSLSSTLVVQ